MKNKWKERAIFFVGMLGIAGPGLVSALDEYKVAKVLVAIACALALAFKVQSLAQRQAQKAEEPTKAP